MMHCDLRAIAQIVEATVEGDCTITIREQGDKYILIVSSPGSKVAAIKIGGLNQLQLRDMAQQIVRLI